MIGEVIERRVSLIPYFDFNNIDVLVEAKRRNIEGVLRGGGSSCVIVVAHRVANKIIVKSCPQMSVAILS